MATVLYPLHVFTTVEPSHSWNIANFKVKDIGVFLGHDGLTGSTRFTITIVAGDNKTLYSGPHDFRVLELKLGEVFPEQSQSRLHRVVIQFTTNTIARDNDWYGCLLDMTKNGDARANQPLIFTKDRKTANARFLPTVFKYLRFHVSEPNASTVRNIRVQYHNGDFLLGSMDMKLPMHNIQSAPHYTTKHGRKIDCIAITLLDDLVEGEQAALHIVASEECVL